MSFLLGRGSAIEWLRQNHDVSIVEPNARWTVPYSSLEASRTRFEKHLPKLEGLTRPIQLVVWCHDDRRRTAITQSHILNVRDGFYPAVKAGDDLFVSSPEFAFLQMANLLDDEQLLFVGFELCGRYGIGAEGVFPRPQVCTSQDLVSCANRMPRVRGRRHATIIAPLVIDGAGSPMEAALALILHTTREEGGYGLPAPELNKSIPVQGKARRQWMEDHITPDLLWENVKLAIEYDSNLHHSASSRIASDAKRRDVLAELGYRVITVTTEHMRSFREIERIAHVVASTLGIDITASSEDELNARTAYQARMRHLALHPKVLCSIPTLSKKRTWSPR